MKKKSIKKKN